MGQVKSDRWSRLEMVVESLGEEGLLGDFCSRVADGEHPREIAKCYGVHAIIFRKWIEDDADRMRMFELAKRCLADHLQWDGIQEARECGVDDVQLGKYRTETYLKAAGTFNRKEYGQKVEIEVNQQISILGALDEARSRVLTMRQSVPEIEVVQEEVVEI